MKDWQGTIEFVVRLLVMLLTVVVIVGGLAFATKAYYNSLEENPCLVTNQK